ncbi:MULTISPECIES: HlyC/CorC family transporter [unclassified Acutalibacter]|jgi:putative hemolysin|uniref:HlyC/CorC family transporter n=1 Tax=unclassified Acutalibacter TaxID=2620728 RepID=UPI001411D329|nr:MULTISPECIES: hemolysin family protein [unclassified Acutalibacter]MCI9223871.1 HlyC/CorC family transporter [Acutalibacter sp.]NBJ88681.1 HlyC/CorC family transporter [Acutalibacter sp. 1XD8-36]
MDSHSTTLIIVLILLIAGSAYFSATETAFSSLNRIRLKSLMNAGNKRAKLTFELSENYDELLSTILVGNNLVNIASTTISTLLFVKALGDASGPTVSTIVMTIVVLVFGEVSPKSLAKENAEAFAMISAPFIRLLIVLLKPVNFLFSQLKKGLSKLVRPAPERGVTGDELLTLVEEAEQDGGIDKSESAMLRNVIEFDDIQAIEIMTPRVDVEAVPRDCTPDEASAVFRETGYSRLPVYDDTIDSIIGVIHEKDFFSKIWVNDRDITSILKPAEFIPPSMKISDLLRLLQQRKQHMAVIVDEFGGTEGIVTLEDIIEELVGEIWDEHDDVVQEGILPIGEGFYRVYGSADTDDLFQLLGIKCETDASTVNGWLAEKLDRIPQVGDSLQFENVQFLVTKAGGNRAEEIRVTVLPGSAKADD